MFPIQVPKKILEGIRSIKITPGAMMPQRSTEPLPISITGAVKEWEVYIIPGRWLDVPDNPTPCCTADHRIVRICDVDPDHHTVDVEFQCGDIVRFDMSSWLDTPVGGRLAHPEEFQNVQITYQGLALEWPHADTPIDFAAGTVYYLGECQ